MSASILIVLVLVLCAVTIGGATLAWMLDQGRRGIVTHRHGVTVEPVPVVAPVPIAVAPPAPDATVD